VSRDGFRLEDVSGVRLVRCEALDAIPGISHAFSTRIADGRPDFDLGPAASPSGEVLARRASFLRAAGMPHADPAVLHQVHGTTLVDDGRPAEADGGVAVFSEGTAAAPAVRSADCVTLLLAEREGGAVASVHAGWRGTAAGIARVAVEALARHGVAPDRVVAALGPAVGPCCYEVGPEVGGEFPGFTRPAGSGRITLDLHAANAAQLAAAGVPARAIHRAPWCTRCRNDLFFSVRAEGAAAGRLMAVIGISAQS
jgi:YfiH family protein